MAGKQVKRVHLLSSVNAANVSKAGAIYTIKDVCGAVDDIVMNGKLYPADQLAAGVDTLEGKPAPAGHPKNSAGQHISALNGEAMAAAWIGAYCRNPRHEAGRTLVDVVVNEAQARAVPAGAKLVERLDAAISGTDASPIHVSTGLFHEAISANGESLGKKYTQIAVNIRYDHLAILVDGQGAGTPEQGVGMFLNSSGDPEEVEVVQVNSGTEDRRNEKLLDRLKLWAAALVGNATELSFDQIDSGLRALLPEGAWPREVYARDFVWVDRDDRLWKQGYAISADGSLAFVGQAVEVTRTVEYVPITNQEKDDAVKEHILAALNAAGITTAGQDDTQLLAAYNALVIKPTGDKLVAANSQIAGFEAKELAATNAERDTLAAKLAVNSTLTVDDLKLFPLARLKELDATAGVKAAPVVVGNAAAPTSANEFAGYDMNKLEA